MRSSFTKEVNGYFRSLGKKLHILSESLTEKNNVDIYNGQRFLSHKCSKFSIWPKRSSLTSEVKGYLKSLGQELHIWSKSLTEKNNVDIYSGSWVMRALSFQFDIRGQVWPHRSKVIRQWGCNLIVKLHRKKLIQTSITVLEFKEIKVLSLTSEIKLTLEVKGQFLCS